MSSNAKELAEILQSLAHQQAGISDTHQAESDCRSLASVLVQALQHHSASGVAAWVSWRLRTSQRPDHRPVMSLNEGELAQQINDVKRVRKLSKRKQRNSSKLDPYRAELLELRNSGTSWSELRDWLRRYGRIKVDRSTVIRRVMRWQQDAKT